MKNVTRALGLRFRARHLLILVGYFAILLGILVPVLRFYPPSGTINPSLLILLASPWLLGVLVLVVERKGPVKYWAAPLLLSLTAPALAVGHDWVILAAWRQSGTIPNTLISLLFNIALIGSFSLYFAAMYPGCCPRCGHRTLIPLLRPWNSTHRTAHTRWCGSCGAKYWRNREGLLQKERRSTWVDALVKESPSATSGGEPRGADGAPPAKAPIHTCPAPRGKLVRRPATSAGSSSGTA